MRFKDELKGLLLVALLSSVALGRNPAASCVALIGMLLWQIADRYFHNSFFDEHEKSIAQLKAELARIKSKQDQHDLKAAFRGNNG